MVKGKSSLIEKAKHSRIAARLFASSSTLCSTASEKKGKIDKAKWASETSANLQGMSLPFGTEPPDIAGEKSFGGSATFLGSLTFAPLMLEDPRSKSTFACIFCI